MILNWIKHAPGACVVWFVAGVLIMAILVDWIWPGNDDGED